MHWLGTDCPKSAVEDKILMKGTLRRPDLDAVVFEEGFGVALPVMSSLSLTETAQESG